MPPLDSLVIDLVIASRVRPRRWLAVVEAARAVAHAGDERQASELAAAPLDVHPRGPRCLTNAVTRAPLDVRPRMFGVIDRVVVDNPGELIRLGLASRVPFEASPSGLHLSGRGRVIAGELLLARLLQIVDDVVTARNRGDLATMRRCAKEIEPAARRLDALKNTPHATEKTA